MIIDGKKIAEKIKQEIKQEVDEIIANGGRRPHLTAILIGNNGPSETYVNNKVKACEACGFESSVIRFDENVTEDELCETIYDLNHDDTIDGFIVQLPLPHHINKQRVIETINYKKDVDGFHPVNVGRLSLGLNCFIPATPLGILTMLTRCNIDPYGKNCVILGRSNIVGKPIAHIMTACDATVTMCHSKTDDIISKCKEADILIAAIGQPEFVTADMIKDGAIVIDVGINRVKDESKKSGYRICGDVDFENVKDKCSLISPVPGGVGPMTICMLMENTLNAYKHTVYKL